MTNLVQINEWAAFIRKLAKNPSFADGRNATQKCSRVKPIYLNWQIHRADILPTT